MSESTITDSDGTVRLRGRLDPQSVYVQDSDPGAVGAGKLYVFTGDDPPSAYIRNSADDAWLPWFPAEASGIPQGGPLDEALDIAGQPLNNVGPVNGNGSDWNSGTGSITTTGTVNAHRLVVDDRVTFSGLPNTDPGVAGRLYTDSGVLMVSGA